MRCVSKNCPFKNVNADNCHFFAGCDFARPQPTNGDRIRAMTDEQLATLFDCFSSCAICEEAERLDDNPFLKDEKCDEDCEAHILKWLKQPAKEET